MAHSVVGCLLDLAQNAHTLPDKMTSCRKTLNSILFSVCVYIDSMYEYIYIYMHVQAISLVFALPLARPPCPRRPLVPGSHLTKLLVVEHPLARNHDNMCLVCQHSYILGQMAWWNTHPIMFDSRSSLSLSILFDLLLGIGMPPAFEL